MAKVIEGYSHYEILLDPKTYSYLGERIIAIKDQTSTGEDGTWVVKKGAILDFGNANGIRHRRPARPALLSRGQKRPCIQWEIPARPDGDERPSGRERIGAPQIGQICTKPALTGHPHARQYISHRELWKAFALTVNIASGVPIMWTGIILRDDSRRPNTGVLSGLWRQGLQPAGYSRFG